MAVSYIPPNGVGSGGNTTTLISCSVPANVQTGDIVLIATWSGASQEYESVTDNNSVAATQIAGGGANTNGTFQVWWYRAPVTLPTSFNCDRGAGGGQPLTLACAFRGCLAAGTPYEDATYLAQITTPETTPDSALITTTSTARMAVCMVGIGDDPDWSSGFPPAGWSDGGGDSSTTGSDARCEMMYQAIAAAGDVAATVIGTLPGATYWRSVTMALIPAAGKGIIDSQRSRIPTSILAA